MSFNVPNTFQTKFLNNVELALQQQKSVLEGAVYVADDASAEKIKCKDIIGNTAPQESDVRHGPTKWNNRTYDGVWIAKPNELYDAELYDDADKLATAIDLRGAGTMAAAGTINRAKDQRILEGFYGDIISGKSGTVTTAFPAGQIIPVTTGGAAGAQKMNTKKLREANVLLRQGYVDPTTKKFMILTAEDNDALLDEVPATSTDFQRAFGAQVDENGLLIRMLGFTFLHMELDNDLLGPVPDLATDGSGYRKNPFWAANGVYANYWQRLRSKVGEIPEREFATGTLMGTTLAASRTQPEMSGIILNAKG